MIIKKQNKMKVNLKRLVFTSSLMLMIVFAATSQNYNSAIGVRGGSLNGLTFKHFLGSNAAFEGILATRWRGFHVTGLYEKHATAFNNEQFQWYYGAGAHVGFYDGYKNHPYFHDDDHNKDYVVIGIDGILGLEYAIEAIPISIGIDRKPEFNIVGYSGFWFGDGGIAIRYYW